jgi:hypothetical protein
MLTRGARCMSGRCLSSGGWWLNLRARYLEKERDRLGGTVAREVEV